MNGYLLLRDNKQTGPYSKEEIIEKGFKPYDLIWAEGKSAGWRYPGELAEFAAYAPMVEEQPFDRFFKKPASSASSSYNPVLNTTSSISTSNTASVAATINTTVASSNNIPEKKLAEPIAEIIPEQAPAKVIPFQPKKIFVTLPGSTVIPAATKSQPVASRPINAEEARYMPAAVPDKPITSVPEIKEQVQPAINTTTPSYSSFQQTKQFIQDRIEQKEEKLYIPQGKTTPRSFFMGAVAACLLLGGIVIGLLISNNKQSSEQQQVENRFKQLQQDKENRKQGVSEPTASPLPTQEAVNNQTTPSVPDSKVELKQENDNSSIAKTVANKEPRTEEKVPASKPISDNEKSSSPVNTNPDTEKSIANARKNNQSPELPRQNIYELVLLEGNNYKIGVLGGISNLQLTVSNNSLYPIDQVEVLVNYMNLDKKIVKKETVYINDVPAGEQKTLTVPKSKRGVSVTYSITKINSRALGLAHSGL